MKKIISQYSGLKKEIYVLFLGKLVTAMGSFVWPMLTFFLTTKLGFSDGTATFLMAAASTVMLPMALLGGKLADRFSRKYIIIVFDFLTVSLYFAASLLPIGIHTAILVFFAGMFQTIESPAYDSLNADFSTTRDREKAFSLSYMGFNLGYVVGASVAGILFQYHTNLAFFLNGASILTSTILIWLFVDPKNAIGQEEESEESYGVYETPVDDGAPVLSILRSRKVVLLMMLVGCFASMPSNIVGVLLPLQLKENMGQAGAAIYGYLNSLNGLTVILFTPLLTMLMRRVTEIPKTICGMALFTAGLVFFSTDTFVWLLFVGMYIYTLGEVVTVLGVNPYTSRRIPASHRGRVTGLSSVIYSLFSSFTQFLISFILRETGSNYRIIWTIFICCGAAAMVLYFTLYGSDKKTFPALYEEAA